ncbi:MAG TPA: DUF222 domain-containing protein [Actinomycetes bacterium]|nr:DUF222 domain-containing protein [Actinomycetes bacterium]
MSALDWGSDPGQCRKAAAEPDPQLDAVIAAVGELARGRADGLSPVARQARIVELERLSGMLAAHQLACLEVVDRQGEAQVSGARSTAAWLGERVRLTPGVAGRRIALTRRLAEQPATAAALASGAISMRHAEVLARTVSELAPRLADQAAVTELERNLLTVAVQTDPLRLADVCARIRHQIVPDAAVDADWDAVQARNLAISRTLDGMVAIDGLLDPLNGEAVLAAVQSLSAPAGPEEMRTPGQRRADALGELARRMLGHCQLPTTGGERPQVLVTVDLATLQDTPGSKSAELGWAGQISGELARRIACDAAVARIVLGPHSQPLDVGRATRVVNVGMRRALQIRDRTCRYPGCTVPGQWCDAHHLKHWALGGVTALHNLILLRAFHHTRLHLAGEWITLRPDGRIDIGTDRHVAEHLIDDRSRDHIDDHPDRRVA